jgi:hypothetical protein
MSDRGYLKTPTRDQVLLLAGLGLIAFVASLIIEKGPWVLLNETGKWTIGGFSWAILQEILVAVGTLLLGGSGLAGVLRVWQSQKEIEGHESTGQLILTLLDDMRYVASRLTNLVWEPVRPLAGDYSRIGSKGIWRLLRGGEDGNKEVLVLTMQILGEEYLTSDGSNEVSTPTVVRGLRNVESAIESALTLYSMAAELGSHEPATANDLILTTAQIRHTVRRWQTNVEREDGENRNVDLVKGIIGLMATMMSQLPALVREIDATQEETLRVLRRTPKGQEIANEYQHSNSSEEERIRVFVESVKISREVREALAGMKQELADIMKNLEDLESDASSEATQTSKSSGEDQL